MACAARTREREVITCSKGSLAKTVDAIEETGGAQHWRVAANVSAAGDCEKLVEETERALGPVDILVNNGSAELLRAYCGL